MSKNTSIEERIELLLRKAESTDSEFERDALSAAAEKLMIKHGIEMAQLNLDRDPTRDPIITKQLRFTGIYCKAHLRIASAVAEALGAKSYFMDFRNTVTFTVLDFTSTIDFAIRLIESAVRQAEHGMKVWWNDARAFYPQNEGYRARRSYLEGFGTGIYFRIVDERKEALNEESAKVGELVLARDAQLEAEMPQLRMVKDKRKKDLDASIVGQQDGLKANTNPDTRVIA